MVQILGLTPFKIRKKLQIIKISLYRGIDFYDKHMPGMGVRWYGMLTR